MAFRPFTVLVTRPADMSTARWCAAFAGDTPTIEAAVVSEHPCSPSTCKSASLVGTAMARAMRTTWSKGSIDHSMAIETSARASRDFCWFVGVPGQFHASGGSDRTAARVHVPVLRAGADARHAAHRGMEWARVQPAESTRLFAVLPTLPGFLKRSFVSHEIFTGRDLHFPLDRGGHRSRRSGQVGKRP